MIERFFPDLMVERVQDIDLEMLKEMNIKGLILDIDNTLVAWDVAEADENAKEWIQRVQGHGFQVCIVSNGSKLRVMKFNKDLKLRAVHSAIKPASTGFLTAVNAMGISTEETAVIGDQIFTDVYGGNRLNMYTVLVKPISKRESILSSSKRWLEVIVLRKYKQISEERRQVRKNWKEISGKRKKKARK